MWVENPVYLFGFGSVLSGYIEIEKKISMVQFDYGFDSFGFSQKI